MDFIQLTNQQRQVYEALNIKTTAVCVRGGLLGYRLKAQGDFFLYFLQMRDLWMWFTRNIAMGMVATFKVHLNEPQDGPLGF